MSSNVWKKKLAGVVSGEFLIVTPMSASPDPANMKLLVLIEFVEESYEQEGAPLFIIVKP